MVEIRREVRPASVFRLPARGGADGVLRRRGNVLERLLHVDGRPVVVRVAQLAADSVLFGAWAESADVAEEGIARMRFALAVDVDVRPFHERFRNDALIGRSVRRRPYLRCARRPDPFEALAWGICEQLIEFTRAAAIERRIVRVLGRRCERTGLRDLPAATTLAGTAPARLRSFDLSEARSLTLVRASREVASGRAPLDGDDHHPGWRRLRAISGIGSWTIAMLALHGQGRHDVLPAGDLGYRKLVARLRGDMRPGARVSEEAVLEFFEPYGDWAGLAGAHALALGSFNVAAA